MEGIIEFEQYDGKTIRLKIIYPEYLVDKVIYQYFDEELGKWQRVDEKFVNQNWKQYFVINTFVMVEKIKKKDNRIKIIDGTNFFTIE